MSSLPLIPYGRKSSGEDDTLSRARQSSAIARWAEAEGVELGPLVWEANVSGKKPWQERGLGEVIDAIKRGEADGVVVEEQSRLSRENMRATAEVWEALEKAGARLVCTAEGIDTSKGDHELSFAIRAALAREQWKQYARRMADVKARKIKDGVALGRMPVGYMKDADGRATVDPATAPIIAELYERRAQGASVVALAAWLDEQLPPHLSARWSRQTVLSVIRNPIYKTGRLHYGELVSEHEAGAIVDAALWQVAQRDGKKPVRRQSTRYVLTGLARCAACGGSLEPHTTKPDAHRPNTYGYLKCRNRSCGAKCGASTINLERWTLDTLWAVLGSKVVEPATPAPDLDGLEKQVELAEALLAQALEPSVQVAAGDGWAQMIAERRTARDAALAELGEAQRQAEAPGSWTDLRDTWAELSVVEQRTALKRHGVEAVMVDGPKPDNWELVLR